MLNVNQITSQLAKMPDNALQQYATMHKADPYMLALTIAESNRRKEMRTAAQGAQGAMQQPKVADQAIAGMSPQQLPENVGIGALPADNMKGMAGGGIVAFDEGGEVGMSYEDQMSQLGQFLNPWERFKSLIGAPGSKKQDDTPATPRRDINAERDRAMALVNAEGLRPTMKNDPRLPAGYKPETAAAAVPEIKKGLGATAAGQQSGLSGGAGGVGAYKPSTLADMMKEVSPEVEKMNAEDRKAMDPFRTQFEEERASLAKRKETNKGEALLAAGLGMMAGNSRYALQNIGAGGAQGLASLKEATRADDAAKRALMQSEMHLAQAEMQGRKGNFQSMNQLANQARQEKQFATSSALQAQQIAQQGQYYRDMGEAAKARGGNEAKLTAEIDKLTGQAKDLAKSDMRFATATPAMQRQIIKEHFDSLAQNNPFIMRALLAQGVTGSEDKDQLTRTLD